MQPQALACAVKKICAAKIILPTLATRINENLLAGAGLPRPYRGILMLRAAGQGKKTIIKVHHEK